MKKYALITLAALAVLAITVGAQEKAAATAAQAKPAAAATAAAPAASTALPAPAPIVTGPTDFPAGATTWAQPQLDPKGWSRLYFDTHLGSFKSIDGEGHMEFSFTGTVLVTDIQGSVTPSAGLRVEYSKHGRTVYFGTGKIAVEGKWRGIQWFGSDMTGIWTGRGTIRLVGEFDRNLQTGNYHYEGDKDSQYWGGSNLIQLILPKPVYGVNPNAVPHERKAGG